MSVLDAGKVAKMAQQYEAKLVNEYLISKYPNDLQWRRVRVGPVPTKEDARYYGVMLRWADAIVKHGNVMLIIEAKVKADLGAMSQIEEYIKLFGQTPEFSEYWDLQRKGVLLTGFDDLMIKQSCAERGIDYVVYKPMWINEYLNKLQRVGQQ